MLLNEIFSKKKLSNLGANDWITDATPENFMDVVVNASHSAVVLLDFWAPWCGPCKHLSPILEAAVANYAGNVRLAKVNIDEHESIAAQFRIQSIPTVYAFAGGKPVDAFSGNISEQKLAEFINKALAVIGYTPSEDALRKMLDSANDAFHVGDFNNAAASYMEILTLQPDHDEANTHLSKCYALTGCVTEAKAIALKLDTTQSNVKLLESLIQFIEEPGFSKKDPLGTDFLAAHNLLQKGQITAYLDQMLTLLQKDRLYENELFKKTLLTFFSFFDADQKYIMECRRRLSKVLFS